ncbi:ABC transporter substrate-binding protein [Microbacterium sp. 18062]|uniref:ABC transporter substrate-binding protein n=1 Tax=Microbacterium sp. 18062 TaxID=2681410 RepID=UPI0013583879|nr:ABC transporter substrate-binding protein [Microbacterium sp. 18062]
MFTKTRTAIVASITVAVLALTACTGGSTDDGNGSPGDDITIGPFGGEQLAIGDPVRGGSFTYGLSFSVPTLDSAAAMGGSTEFALTAVYDNLMRVEPDGSVGPGIAEGITTDDNLVWTLSLRDGVVFSDGEPFDADAVIAQIERVAAEDSASLEAADARSIASVTALDAQTVEFTLAAENSQFPLLLAQGSMSMIASPKAVEELGADFAFTPVGAGPFVVDSFTPDGDIVLSRNDTYWDEELPYLDAATLTPVLDEQSRISGVLSGDLDASSVASIPALQSARDQGALGLEEPRYSGYLFQPNIENEHLSDIRVRQALSYAIDRDAINDVLFEGLHSPMDSYLVPSQPFYEAGLVPQYDPEQAVALIEEYKADTGVTEISLELMVNQIQESSDLGALLQQQLGEVGIDLQPTVMEPATQISNIVAGTFDAMLMDRAFPAETTQIFSQAFGANFRNFGSGTNPDFDALIAQAVAAPTDADRQAVIPEMLAVLSEWMPVVPIVSTGLGRVLGPDVAGFPDGDPNATSSEMFDLRKVWMAAEQSS